MRATFPSILIKFKNKKVVTEYKLLNEAWLFSKQTSRYCHSPGVVGGVVVIVVRRHAKTLTFYNISVITEDIYLKLTVFVHYQKGNPYQ